MDEAAPARPEGLAEAESAEPTFDFQVYDGKVLTETEERDLDVEAESAMWHGINLDALAPKLTWRWDFQASQNAMKDRLRALGKTVYGDKATLLERLKLAENQLRIHHRWKEQRDDYHPARAYAILPVKPIMPSVP